MGNQTESDLNHLKDLLSINASHFDILQRLYNLTEERTDRGDFDESKYYEGWDTILNHFRMETNHEITIAPQRRFKRNFYDDKIPGMYIDDLLLGRY